MSFGKADMSNESMYQQQERKDAQQAAMRFATPQPMHRRHAHGAHGEHQMECFSDEVDSRRGTAERKEPGPGAIVVAQPASGGGGGGDGSSIEVSKKRRGRPPGSKNKPKPPVVITREAEPAAAMRPHVIEIPGGRDVAEALSRFATRRGLGICVLAGTGAVANVSLRHPCPGGAASAPAVVVFQGRFEILSISATFLAPAVAAVAPQAAAAASGLSISLAGPHGQIVGGAVVGPLYAATNVVIVAAAFTNPTFHRLPADDDAPVSVSVSLSGSADAADEHRGHQQHQPEPQVQQQQLHLRRQPPHLAAAAAATSSAQPLEPSGVPVYTCHPQPQEVMWPPAPRAPHQPPPPPPPY